MDKPSSSALKTLFLVHAVVGLIFGLSCLVMPATLVGWLNMPLTAEPYLRMVGVAILGHAATATVEYRARNWDGVKIAVQGEFVCTGLAATISVWFAWDGTWPVAGWLIFVWPDGSFLPRLWLFLRAGRKNADDSRPGIAHVTFRQAPLLNVASPISPGACARSLIDQTAGDST